MNMENMEFKKLEEGVTIRMLGEPVPLRMTHFKGKSESPIACAKELRDRLVCPFCRMVEEDRKKALKLETGWAGK